MDKVIYIQLNGVPGLEDFSFLAVAPTINFANMFEYSVSTEPSSPLTDRNFISDCPPAQHELCQPLSAVMGEGLQVTKVQICRNITSPGIIDNFGNC